MRWVSSFQFQYLRLHLYIGNILASIKIIHFRNDPWKGRVFSICIELHGKSVHDNTLKRLSQNVWSD